MTITGYLPMNTNNPRCAEIEAGVEDRRKPTNIRETYHQNPPGYSGFTPKVAFNDKGPRQVVKMSTFGRDF